MRTPTDIFPNINTPVITVADSISAPGAGQAGLTRAGRARECREGRCGMSKALRRYETESPKESGSQRQSSCAFKEVFMGTNRNQSGWNVEDLTTQRYLPQSIILTRIQVVKTVLIATEPPVESASVLMIFFFDCAAVILLYHCTR